MDNTSTPLRLTDSQLELAILKFQRAWARHGRMSDMLRIDEYRAELRHRAIAKFDPDVALRLTSVATTLELANSQAFAVNFHQLARDIRAAVEALKRVSA